MTESSLEAVDPTRLPDGLPIKPGSVGRVEVGGATLTVYVTTHVVAGPRVLEAACVSTTSTNRGCTGAPQGRPWLLEFGWSSAAGFHSVSGWLNVPEDAAYVEFEDGDLVLWQRPIAGVALFPEADLFGGRVDAIAADGTVVARAGREEMITAPADATIPASGRRDRTADEEMTAATNDAALRCLAEAGWENPLAPEPDAGDPDEIWRSCLEHAREAATAAIESSGGESSITPTSLPA